MATVDRSTITPSVATGLVEGVVVRMGRVEIARITVVLGANPDGALSVMKSFTIRQPRREVRGV